MGKGARNRRERSEQGGVDVLSVLAERSQLVHNLKQFRDSLDAHLLLLHTSMPALLPGLDHARLFLDDIATEVASPALATLLTRASDDVRRGFIAAVADDIAGVNDISRDLMEIEVLLADFCRAPESMERWSTLPTRQRSDEYKFGKLLDRVGMRQGVPPGMAHPLAAEYQAHSAGLHPTPEGRSPGPEDTRTRMVVSGSDLIEHVRRVVGQLLELIEKVEGILSDGPPRDAPPAWDLAVVMQAAESGREVVQGLREAAEKDGILFRPREPYSRREFPDGPFRVVQPPEGEADATIL